MVGGPAHGPRVDVVELAACTRARTLVTLAILKELLLAMSHRRRDGAVVPCQCRYEGQPPQNGGDGDNVDDGPGLGLIQLLRSALARYIKYICQPINVLNCLLMAEKKFTRSKLTMIKPPWFTIGSYKVCNKFTFLEPAVFPQKTAGSNVNSV